MALTIEYRHIGRLPTCVGNERIRVESDGRVSHSRNTVECKDGSLWSSPWQAAGRLDATAMTQLERQISESGVLRLPAESIDEAVEGGRREEIDLTLDDRPYQFVAENVSLPPFRAVVTLLWGALAAVQR